MFLIVTPQSEFKASKATEVIEFLNAHFHLQIPKKEITELTDHPLSFASFINGAYQVSKEDGRTLKDVDYVPI